MPTKWVKGSSFPRRVPDSMAWHWLPVVASLMQMECEIHMGEIDIKKEWANVRRMQVLGATVVPATEGGKSLKEAVDSACKSLLIY